MHFLQQASWGGTCEDINTRTDKVRRFDHETARTNRPPVCSSIMHRNRSQAMSVLRSIAVIFSLVALALAGAPQWQNAGRFQPNGRVPYSLPSSSSTI
jgi:hypothetical protein